MSGHDPNSGDGASGADGLAGFAQLVRRLNASLTSLELAAKPLQLEPLAGREWFDSLTRRLLPQLTDGAYLIVAVMGGTNIGKSAVFNHIAGFRASASSPLASGTKHPVCLVPVGFAEQHDPRAMFPAFELRSWTSGDEALLSIDTDCLFWREHECVPDNLVILDTPDIDSDAPENWRRADKVRQAANVLVVVLTQQKYNDAAVKKFFRKAAEVDTTAIAVINQVELPDDEKHWPIWLNTFCGETGLKPEYVYLAPNDRKAAEAITLKFVERKWPVKGETGGRSPETGGEAKSPLTPTLSPEDGGEGAEETSSSSSLSAVLSQLRFAEIKLRTLRGSISRLVDGETGVPAYLREVTLRSRQFRDAADVFASRAMVRQANWPAPPNGLLVDEMWSWWDKHRDAVTAGIHGFYTRISRSVMNGIRFVRVRFGHQPTNHLEKYRKDEREAMTSLIEQLFEKMEETAKVGNDLLRDRLEPLLSGDARNNLFARLSRDHDQFDFDALVKELVETEMAKLKTEREQLFKILRYADQAAAIARPVITVGLAFGGLFGADNVIAEAVVHTVGNAAVAVTGAAAATVAGEAAVETAGGVLGQAKAWLLQLHQKFKAEREAWLVAQLREHLLGELLDELQAGANVPDAAEFGEVEAALGELTSQLNDNAG